jgi:ABC-type antimicrobial peptide transport system permease subunit
VLAGLGVLNALVTTISERTAEIGVLKALGATDADIARLVIAEALVLGAIGGVCGVALGWVGASAAATAGRALSGPARLALETVPDPRVALAAMLVTMALAALGAWLPAQRAARMAPAEALRLG